MMSRILPQSDGSRTSMIQTGEGEALLLIHGVGMRAEAWTPQIDALCEDNRIIAVNMPGHGESPPLAPSARLPEFVAWAIRLVETLDLGPVNVAGHSMGALVAAGMTVERPDLVHRLAMLNAVYCRTPEARASVVARADELARGEGTAEGQLNRWFGDSDVAIRNQVGDWLDQMDQQSYVTAYRSFAEGDRIYADRLNTIACPTLVLTGEGDPNSSPSMTKEIARQIVGARDVVVPGHRHMVNLTAPEIVSSAMKSWLATARSPRSSEIAARVG